MADFSLLRTAAVLSIALCLATCLAQTPPRPASTSPVATVNGQPIYEEDLASALQGQLQQLRTQEYEATRRVLEGLINKRLVEAAASAAGLSAEKLLQQIDAQAAEPTAGEVEAFYLGQKDRINRPLDEIRTQLLQSLRQARIQQRREDYFRRLREKAQVAILLRPPKIQVSIDAARLRGNPSAPVTIVEFSDFQCPFCQRAESAVREILAKYGGKVRLAYRDFPLAEIHAQAHKAAEAARCAGEEGRFWEYHDALLADNSKLGDADLVQRAQTLGLDQKRFESCLASNKYGPAVDEDFRDGTNAGVQGTPAFVINGTLLEGAQPASAFQSIIDPELASLAANTP